MDTIYVPNYIADYFGLDGEEEPGPDGETVVSVSVNQYRAALLTTISSLGEFPDWLEPGGPNRAAVLDLVKNGPAVGATGPLYGTPN